jgi:hypothetical protein
LAARLLLATEVAVKDGTRPRLRLRPFSDWIWALDQQLVFIVTTI